jgi:hypothetical protein
MQQLELVRFLDFDEPQPPDPQFSSDAFATILLDPDFDVVWFLDGIVAAGDSFYITFSIDVPGTSVNPDPPTEFTLRQFASVIPEPSALGLFAVGALLVGRLGSRRARR